MVEQAITEGMDMADINLPAEPAMPDSEPTHTPRFHEVVTLKLEPEDAEWLLEVAKAEYVEFLEGYPDRRDYHRQQRAERIAAALGVRLTMFNKGDNTYAISQSDIPPDAT
jgi:hypothetical protein